MLEANDDDGDIITSMLVKGVSEQRFTGKLRVFNIADQFDCRLVVRDIPELAMILVNGYAIKKDGDVLHRKP